MGKESFETPGDVKGGDKQEQKPRRNNRLSYNLGEQIAEYNKQKSDNNVGVGGFLGETTHSFVYQGSAGWIKGAGQLLDDAGNGSGLYKGNKVADGVTTAFSLVGITKPEEATYGSRRWYAQQIGSGFGMAVPFALTHSARSLTGISMAARVESSTGAAANTIRIADSALTGFASDFIFRPLEGEEAKGSVADHLLTRTKHGAGGAVTLGTITAGSLALRQVSRPLAAAITAPGAGNWTARRVYDAAIGMTSGIPAGEVSARTSAFLDGRQVTDEERARARWTMAFTGGVLSATHVTPRDQKSLDNFIENRNKRANLAGLLSERGKSDAPATSRTRVAPPVSETAGSSADQAVRGKGGSSDAGQPHKVEVVLNGERTGDEGKTESRDKGPKPGKSFASADVDGSGQHKQTIELPTERAAVLGPALQQMVTLAYEASRPGAPAEKVDTFAKLAGGDPAELGKLGITKDDLPVLHKALKQVADNYRDPDLSGLVDNAFKAPDTRTEAPPETRSEPAKPVNTSLEIPPDRVELANHIQQIAVDVHAASREGAPAQQVVDFIHLAQGDPAQLAKYKLTAEDLPHLREALLRVAENYKNSGQGDARMLEFAQDGFITADALTAARADARPSQVADFIKLGRGDEAELAKYHLTKADLPKLQQHLTEIAQHSGNKQVIGLVREAFMPADGVEFKPTGDGSIKVKVSLSPEAIGRWGEFMTLLNGGLNAEGHYNGIPRDPEGYAQWRQNVIGWLNKLDPKNADDAALRETARQYAEQNRHSELAGPFDQVFGTNHLQKFADAARSAQAGQRLVADAPVREGSGAAHLIDPTRVVPKTIADQGEGGPARERPTLRRVDLGKTLDQARADQKGGGPMDRLLALGAKPQGIVGDAPAEDGSATRAPEQRPAPEVKTPAEIEAREQAKFEERWRAFESNMTKTEAEQNQTALKIDASLLANNFGRMSTEQFAHWLNYALSKPPNGADGALNLRTLQLRNREVLASPEVVDAYNKFIDGDTAPLETLRKFLSAPEGKAPPLPDAVKDFIRLRVAQVEDMDGATAQQKLDAAFPPGFVSQLKQQYVSSDAGKPAMQKLMDVNNPPEYSSELPQPLIDLLEAARAEQKGPQKPSRPETTDLPSRLSMLGEVLKIQDPVLRSKLMELGQNDPMSLRNILPKLNPEKSAPEYQELIKIAVEHSDNIKDLQRLLDAMFWANKSDRNLRDATKPPRPGDTRRQEPPDAAKLADLQARADRDRELAVALTDGLVPQSDPKFQRAHDIVDGVITGKIRDPRPDDGGKEPPGQKKNTAAGRTETVGRSGSGADRVVLTAKRPAGQPENTGDGAKKEPGEGGAEPGVRQATGPAKEAGDDSKAPGKGENVPTLEDISMYPPTAGGMHRYQRDMGLTNEDFAEGKVVVDVGAGLNQNLARDAQAQGLKAKVISVDPRLLLSEAEDLKLYSEDDRPARIEARKNPMPNTVAAFGHDMPIPDNSVDTVVARNSTSLYQHDPAHIKATLTEFVRVLKEGGVAKVFPISAREYSMYKDILDSMKVKYEMPVAQSQPGQPESYMLVISKTKSGAAASPAKGAADVVAGKGRIEPAARTENRSDNGGQGTDQPGGKGPDQPGGKVPDQRGDKAVTEPDATRQSVKPVDVDALKKHEKVQVEGKEAIFIDTDERTGDVVVRTGKPSREKETSYTAKQFNKLVTPKGDEGAKWVFISNENDVDIYRDQEGNFHGVRQHGAGYMVGDRPEYKGVKPESVFPKDAVVPQNAPAPFEEHHDDGKGKDAQTAPVPGSGDQSQTLNGGSKDQGGGRDQTQTVDDGRGTGAANPALAPADGAGDKAQAAGRQPQPGPRDRQRRAEPERARPEVQVDNPAFERLRGFNTLKDRGIEVETQDNKGQTVTSHAFDGHVKIDLSDFEGKVDKDYDANGVTPEMHEALIKALRDRGYRMTTVRNADRSTTPIDEAIVFAEQLETEGKGMSKEEFLAHVKQKIDADLPHHDAMAMGKYIANYFKRIIADAKPRVSQVLQTQDGELVPEIELNWPGRKNRVSGLIVTDGNEVVGILDLKTHELLKIADLPKVDQPKQ